MPLLFVANCFLICSVNSLQCSVNSFQCPVNLSYVIIPLSIFIILELFLILFLASTLLAGATTYCVDITNDNRRTCIHDYTMICLQRLKRLPGIYLASMYSYCVYTSPEIIIGELAYMTIPLSVSRGLHFFLISTLLAGVAIVYT